MKRPRLVIVTQCFWPLVGATETIVARLAHALSRRGCGVTIVTAKWRPRWPSEISFHGVPVKRLSPPPSDRWTNRQWMRSLARWLRCNVDNFDLVYVMGLRGEAYVAMKTLGGRRPVVVAPRRAGRHGDCVWQLDAPCGKKIKSQCMRADALVAMTPALRRELEAAGYDRLKIHDALLGVDLPPLRTPEIREAARRGLAEANPSLEISASTPLAVSTSLASTNEEWHTLFDAWSAIAPRWPGARLWMAGPHPDRAGLVRKIDALGQPARIAPIGVFDDVEGLLSAADLFIAPSAETSSLGIIEAMAAGLPAIAAAPVGPGLDGRWPMVHDDEGLWFERGNSAALAAAITRVLDQPELAARLGSAARQRAAHDFSLARMTDDHLTLFERLVSGATTDA